MFATSFPDPPAGMTESYSAKVQPQEGFRADNVDVLRSVVVKDEGRCRDATGDDGSDDRARSVRPEKQDFVSSFRSECEVAAMGKRGQALSP